MAKCRHGIGAVRRRVRLYPVELAAQRFEARTRHPGHHDPVRTPAEVDEHVRRMRGSFRGPLRVGRLVTIDTSRPLEVDEDVRRVREAVEDLLGPGGAPARRPV